MGLSVDHISASDADMVNEETNRSPNKTCMLKSEGVKDSSAFIQRRDMIKLITFQPHIRSVAHCFGP